MFLKGSIFRNVFIVTILFLAMVGAIAFMTGCATTGGSSQAQVDPVRQKAIQDSLNKAYQYQLDLNFSIGNEHRKNNNFRSAVKPFWKVVELDTINRFPDIFSFLGTCYMNLEQPDSALMVFQLGTKRAPNKIHNHRMTAFLLAAKGEREQAVEEYKKTIELDPDKVDDYKAMGTLLISLNDLEGALAAYNKISELDPQDAEAQNIIADLIKRSGGDIKDIIAAKEEALSKNPDDIRLMFELGEMYFKELEYMKSIEKFNLLLAKNPNDVRTIEYIGSAYQNLGEYKSAIDTYEKLLAIKPDHIKVICEEASCYNELKQFARARSLADKAIKMDPSNGYGYMVKGEIYEATADACINARDKRVVNIDDKLVYQLAYDEYQKATKDVQFEERAKSRMNYIKQDTPSTEDKFMFKNKTKAELDCYKWIY